MNNFCTLFDSFYLDKGLALYNSLSNTRDDFKLYIFAFDDICLDILLDLRLEKAEIISLKQFETEELLKVKKDRTKAEYCWTCTPWVIKYIFDNYGIEMCTYIDADLYFFKSPKVLLDEIHEHGDSIIITEHRFKRDKDYTKNTDTYGKYCVEFNTFRNNSSGREALNWWANRCLEWCFYKKDGNLLGDQKYLDNWTERFEGVHELQNLGGGVAPWNLDQYSLKSSNGLDIHLIEKSTGREFALIFYHFQNMRYISNDLINIKSGTKNISLKKAIYLPYLLEIEKMRLILANKYHLSFTNQKVCSSNPAIAFIQKNIMQFKCKSFSDIMKLNKFR